ncbi:hypothetical protein B0H66DRAFT_2680 [Apodospora peruviana]|uniref:ABC transporter domain-containing protein n=1 Tax=Apodospora peruviana TaxID=516989 RepID=A0AAE0IPL2_9PEZI|nr:hypothetical protein B0H66DRAFT_2680 [Apodospora peruviana]
MALLDFGKQVKALVKKNLILLVTRHWISTLLQAVIVPILILALTLNIRNFSPTRDVHGFGNPTPIRSIQDSIPESQRLVLVKLPGLGPDVDRVIDKIASPIPDDKVQIFESNDPSDTLCPFTFRGVSNCYAVVTFIDSPLSEGYNQTWNYTIRFDPSRNGDSYNVHADNNDFQVYYFPVQLAVDNAITNLTEVPYVWPFSIRNQTQVDEQERFSYGYMVITTYVILFFLSILPFVYHVVAVITEEREAGLAELVDAMGGSPSARVISHVISFSIIYFPTWLIMGCLYWYLLFPESNAAILIFWQIFNGLAILNASIFAAAFFTKRRISSIFTVVCFVALGGGAAILINREVKTGTVITLSLLFPAMNYIFTVSFMAIFALGLSPINMNQSEIPFAMQLETYEQKYFVAVWTFWVLLIVQIFAYPALAILAERLIHGLNFRNRTMTPTGTNTFAIKTTGLSKVYEPSWFQRIFCFGKKKGFQALDDLGLVAQKNQILCLLGVNGAGKSTTLDLLSGFQAPTAGEMFIDAGHSQLGICPQKNVLFGRLTVLEHVKFWSDMKGGGDDAQALHDIIEGCDLSMKTHSQAATLSGGQKRKLQLACMFVGGTTVCLMDEVTSGLDPISRRTIWNIILAERAKRSMVFTTHFLDEGEVLADHIVILSKGQIKCQGSGAELKSNFGGGYRVHIPRDADIPGIDAPRTVHQDRVVYRTPDSRSAAQLVAKMEAAGHSQVQIAGPTIEDVFLGVAEDDVSTDPSELAKADDSDLEPVASALSSGKRTSFAQQVRTLMMKRLRILPRYWAAAFLALALPIATMPAINTFMANDFARPTCGDGSVLNRWVSPISWYSSAEYTSTEDYGRPFGPSSLNLTLFDVMDNYPIGYEYDIRTYSEDWKFVNNYELFQQAVRNIPPNYIAGGLYMGDNDGGPPTIALSLDSYYSQEFFNVYTAVRSGVQIAANRESFYIEYGSGSGDDSSWQYILYAAFILAIYPCFFALYPAFEKSNNVRALQYSNGVRPIPLWTSYFLFDLCFVLAVSIAYTVTISQQFPYWWNPGYMFVICLFHGTTSILFAYIVSSKAKSQLAAFLWVLGATLIAYLGMALTYLLPAMFADPLTIQDTSDKLSYVLDLFFPIGNVFRAMAVGLNLFRLGCRDDGSAVNPGSWWGYGFPITYLVLQIIVFGALLIWLDSDLSFTMLLRHGRRGANTASDNDDGVAVMAAPGVEKEAARVAQSQQQDLLRMVHVTKSFNGTPAVSDVSLGLGEGEILALLGPNGAGKTTIVNMVRGEMRPEHGQIFLRDVDVSRHPRLAQKAIGVCPQFDALDLLTARQHLEFYARIKGIDDVKANVEAVMARVGLTAYADRQAAKLSGGNKRKLSLAIALMGNPDVLILDEPSSSMDAAAKRRMWKILAEIAPGRSLLLTTHSMEEADALATRAAILSQRLLAIGTTQSLREEYSNLYHVQLVLKTAPNSTVEETREVEAWVRREFVDVTFEGPSLGGQVKFMVPAAGVAKATPVEGEADIGAVKSASLEKEQNHQNHRGVGYFIELLERHREELGLADYSIGAPTLERVFLSVVKDNYVEEDGVTKGRKWKKWFGWG